MYIYDEVYLPQEIAHNCNVDEIDAKTEVGCQFHCVQNFPPPRQFFANFNPYFIVCNAKYSDEDGKVAKQ